MFDVLSSARFAVQDVRFADVLDVLVVAVFLYALISWLQESTSRGTARRTLVIALIFGTIYVLARFFELYLTEMVLQVLIVVFTLAAIVVFQADIRRMVDRIGTWGSSGTTSQTAHSATIDSLVEAAEQMATTRTGALIALKGNEPWDRHTEGGIAMDGKASQVLLRSLFNPTSPGHDGAVLLNGPRITRFAVHLPLSSNKAAVGPHGTRHAAALGLAELCDALVIVVSEETGAISVAEDGRLHKMASAADLRARLERFWVTYYDGAPDRPSWWRRRSLRKAALALGMATLLWALFAHRPDTVHRVLEVPIELRNLADEWDLQSEVPTTARVTLAGSEQAFRLLDPASLVLSLNMGDLQQGANEFILSADDIDLPQGITLYSIDPREIDLQAQRMKPVELPVQLRTRGQLPDGLQLGAIDPSEVRLLAPSTRNDLPAKVLTEPLVLDSITEAGSITTRLDVPAPLQLPPDQDAEVQVAVRERQPPNQDE